MNEAMQRPIDRWFQNYSGDHRENISEGMLVLRDQGDRFYLGALFKEARCGPLLGTGSALGSRIVIIAAYISPFNFRFDFKFTLASRARAPMRNFFQFADSELRAAAVE